VSRHTLPRIAAALAAALSLSLLSATARPAAADTFNVVTTADDLSPVTVGSLRWAIQQANATATSGTPHVIDLSAVAGQTITLNDDLPIITQAGGVTVQAPAANRVTIDGNTQYRAFFFGVSAGEVPSKSLTVATTSTAYALTNLTLQNCRARGGDGGTGDYGGGGGAGLGGAVFVNAGTLTATNVNFFGNAADGGNGGGNSSDGAGGGGGIGGNGGNGGSTFAGGGGGGFGRNARGGNGVFNDDNGGPGSFTGAASAPSNGGANGGADGGGGAAGDGKFTATGGGVFKDVGGMVGGTSSTGGFGGGGGGAFTGGTGGYGGGGGASRSSVGAAGGFGGGGGGGQNGGGSGGFGGGSGSGGFGGGGLGAGGAVFVRRGAAFTAVDCGFSGNSVSGGSGGGGDAGDGLALGRDIFFGGDVTITVSSAASVLELQADSLGGGDNDEARGRLTKNGSGTLYIFGTQSLRGASTVSAGSLILEGSVPAVFSVDSGALLGIITADGQYGSAGGAISTINTGGRLSPSHLFPDGIAVLSVFTDLLFQPGSTYEVSIRSPSTYGRVSVVSEAFLSEGTDLSVYVDPSFSAPIGTGFDVLSAGVFTGTFAGLPDGAEFDTGDRRFRINYTPTLARLTYLGDPPSWPNLPAGATAQEGTAFAFVFAPGGNPTPTVSLAGTLPAGLTFSDGRISGTPAEGTAGEYPLIVTASNGVGTAASAPFLLTVTKAGLPTAPLYRLYLAGDRTHLLTTDANEYAVLPSVGWKQEGVAALVYSASGTVGGAQTVPLRRLYLFAEESHLLTADANEFAFLLALGPTLVLNEGVVGHVLPASTAGSVTGTEALWRLYLPSTGDHLLTSDGNEAALLPGVGWLVEGVAGYVPTR
jgi:hypothetical protein